MKIRTENLIKRYGSKFELNVPDLQIDRGEVFGLVGNNGAGKTTLLRLALDLIQATEGSFYSNNINVAKSEEWKKYTGSYLDYGFLIDFLTPEEYFEFVGSLNDMTKEETYGSLENFDKLFNEEILNNDKKYIRAMSSGNKQKIGIAAAMMIKPEVLILDEPFANLDPTSQILLKQLLAKLNKEKKTTMLISSHGLNHITEICTRIALLEDGKIIKDLQTSEETLNELQVYFKPEAN